jgi:hypothetical protein
MSKHGLSPTVLAAVAAGLASALSLLCIAFPADASAADARVWYLRNSNSLGVADSSVSYGDTTQTPVAGDWNADGKDTPGMVRASTWWLSNTLTGTTAQYFAYGSTGMVPITGDWDGNGTDTAGMRQGLRWLLSNVNGNVTASIDFNLGNPSGDVPLSGDWNGDGKETPGVYRRSNHTFYLAGGLSSTCCVATVSYGVVGDTPLVGDWNGDGKDTIGVFRVDGFGAHWQLNNANDASAPDYDFVYGSPGDIPVTGDWNGDHKDTPGVVRTIVTTPPPPAPPADSAAPAITLSGPLFDNRVGAVAGAAPSYELYDHDLDIATSDDGTGVKTARLDRLVSFDASVACSSTNAALWETVKDFGTNPDSGPGTWDGLSYDFASEAFSAVTERFRVTATDAAGNRRTECFDFNVDHVSPEFTVSGPLTTGSITQDLHALDVQAGGAPLRYIRTYYDDEFQSELAVPVDLATGTWSTNYAGDVGPYDASTVGGMEPGVHTVRVEVVTSHLVKASKTVTFTIEAGTEPAPVAPAATADEEGPMTLLREDGTDDVYYVEGEARYLVPSEDVADAADIDLGDAEPVEPGLLGALPRGEDITEATLNAEVPPPPATEPMPDGTITEQSSSGSYVYVGKDQFDFRSSDGKVSAVGTVRWYRGKGLKSVIHRGEFSTFSGVDPIGPQGCIWVKISWAFPTGSASVPGPGGSLGTGVESDGYSGKCRKPGEKKPPSISLGGVAYAKSLMKSVTVTICNSASKTDLKTHCSNHKMHYYA